MATRGSNMKDSDRWETPPSVFGYLNSVHGPFTVDVCAENTTKKCDIFFSHEDDALKIEWGNKNTRAWCNPPYSNPLPWVEKAIKEAENHVTTIMLLPGDVSTNWFKLMQKHSIYYFWPRRIRFLKDGKPVGSPKFGSVVAIFKPEPERIK